MRKYAQPGRTAITSLLERANLRVRVSVKRHLQSVHLQAGCKSDCENAMLLGVPTAFPYTLDRDTFSEMPQYNPSREKPTMAIGF
jgi:hypothetical protein